MRKFNPQQNSSDVESLGYSTTVDSRRSSSPVHVGKFDVDSWGYSTAVDSICSSPVHVGKFDLKSWDVRRRNSNLCKVSLPLWDLNNKALIQKVMESAREK